MDTSNFGISKFKWNYVVMDGVRWIGFWEIYLRNVYNALHVDIFSLASNQLTNQEMDY